MNDNCEGAARRLDPALIRARREALIGELRDIASRAVVKPESLTMGEIQEVGWGFLVAAQDLLAPGSRPRR